MPFVPTHDQTSMQAHLGSEEGNMDEQVMECLDYDDDPDSLHMHTIACRAELKDVCPCCHLLCNMEKQCVAFKRLQQPCAPS